MGAKQNTAGGGGCGLPSAFLALYARLRSVSDDPKNGIDATEAIVRMTVMDSMVMFTRLAGKPPRLLYITKAMEAALQVDRGKNLGYHEREHGRIREESMVFGCRVVWDAPAFKVE